MKVTTSTTSTASTGSYENNNVWTPEMQSELEKEQQLAPTDINDHRLDKLKQRAAELAEMSDNKKKLTFSKRLLVAGLAISLLMCIACVVLRVLFHEDITDIMTITIAAFFTDSAYGSFYLWKEKNANRAKYAQQFVLLFADAYGVEAAIRIAEVVLRE